MSWAPMTAAAMFDHYRPPRTVRQRLFIRWLAVSHVAVGYFIITPPQLVLPAQWLWVAPFIVAAVITLAASYYPTSTTWTAAGTATMVAYASRAIAFPFARMAGYDTPARSSFFGVLIWVLFMTFAWRVFRED